MMRWLKVYLAQMKDMVERDAIQPERARQVAKGLKYAIKALEASGNDHRAAKRKQLENAYQEASEFFD
jgi:hypothetical protein